MFKITCDGTTIYDPRTSDLAIISGKITLELNKAGTFVFRLPPEHTHYDLPQKMASKIIVYWDDTAIFYGRCTDEEIDFWNQKTITCEGELAYLNDTIQRPGEYHDITPREYLETLIASHNSEVDEDRQFTVGIVTVTDSNDSIYRYTNYNSTMTELKEDLVDDLGGYLKVRNEDGYRYLDYVTLDDYGDTSSQAIEFGSNLLDFVRSYDMSGLATAIIPLGAKLDESSYTSIDERLTIADVNDGSDCLQNDDAVETYGFICKTVTWDSVTTAEYLLSKATAYLEDTQFDGMTIEASALDLHYTDDDVMRLKLGDKVPVVSKPHGLDRYFYITAMTVDLLSLPDNTITLGTGDVQETSLTAAASSISTALREASNTQATFLTNAIAQATALITASTHGYVMLNDTDGDGSPDELVIMDTDDTETATNVWRWNMGGLGYSSTGYNGTYGTAITMDGTIVGTYIAAGTVGAEQLSVEYTESVEAEISNAILTAEEYTDEELTNYYTIATLKQELTAGSGELDSIIALTYATKTEVSDLETTLSSEISQTESSILLTVSETYATQSDLASAQETLEASITVNADAISAEVTRATEAEEALSASITATESSILLEVSSTYVTTTTYTTGLSDTLSSAESYTDTALESYSTTEEMTSAISVSASSILSTVSSTYATASSVSTLSSTLTQTASTLEASIEDTQSNARTYFAADSTSISCSSGTVTFKSNTFAVSSTYFTLTAAGKITATEVNVSGAFEADGDDYWIKIDDGEITGGTDGSSTVNGYFVVDDEYSDTGLYGTSIGGRGMIALRTPKLLVTGYSDPGNGSESSWYTGNTETIYVVTSTSSSSSNIEKSQSVYTSYSTSSATYVTSVTTSTQTVVTAVGYTYHTLITSYSTFSGYIVSNVSTTTSSGYVTAITQTRTYYTNVIYSPTTTICYHLSGSSAATTTSLSYVKSATTSTLSYVSSLSATTLYYLGSSYNSYTGVTTMNFVKGLLCSSYTY